MRIPSISLAPLIDRVASVFAKATDRLPHTTNALGTMFDFGYIGQGQGREQLLKSATNSGWLFAVIERIATAVMASTWSLYTGKGEERELVEDHPLLDLWARPNPFFSREAFQELSQGHFELTGETWWLVVRGEDGMPGELWALRPDRMRVIPHPTDYIAGYQYVLGMEKIPLEVADVIFTRRPSRFDPYRGESPLQAIMFDVEGEQFAARYYRNFFANSARPGGVLETPETMGDDEFSTFVERWRAQHQGVSNAHRVAVLEGGTVWKDVKQATARDMQMVDSRKYNRDMIVGAYGVPLSTMGISESVNRANAEAGEVNFQRWTVKPRLMRTRGAINAHLVPMFAAGPGMTEMFFDFANPVPEDREQNLLEAEKGFEGGFLTQNEARRLVGHEDVPDGDDFKAITPPPSFGGEADMAPKRLTTASVSYRPIKALVAGWSSAAAAREKARQINLFYMDKAPDPDDPEYIAVEERIIARNWQSRLEAEAEAIGDYLEPFFKGLDFVPKIEPTDIEGYAWDGWMAKYGDDVIDELTSVFAAIMSAEVGPDIVGNEVQRRAGAYARERGASLLRLDGDVNMVEFTKNRVRILVANTIEGGEGLGSLRKALQDDVAFSKSRADMVARTETREALGQAQYEAAGLMDQNEKRWKDQGDLGVDDPCLRNTAAGWIKREEAFPTGKQRIPEHPNCRCNVIYRTREVQIGWVGRCRTCAKVLSKASGANEVPDRQWCPRCKAERMLGWRRADG